MSRYFTRAIREVTPDPEDSFYDLDDFHGSDSITVHEDDLETFTGLLDSRGHEIHRCERIQMGFERPQRRRT